MFYRNTFAPDWFADLDRLQSALRQGFSTSPSIRGGARGGYPAINVGGSPEAVEIHVFAPGLDPASIDVQLENGVLTVAGERPSVLPPREAPATTHIDERFAGRFRRVVSLPDDIDPNAVSARYRDGILQISVRRRAAAQPRRIAVEYR